MNQVIQLNSARNLRAAQPAIDLEDIFFDVAQIPLTQLTGLRDQGQTAIVRQDTQQILAVHGKQYKLTPNRKVFSDIDKLILESTSIDTNGMQIVDKVAYAGGRTIRSYIFPEHTVKIARGDETHLRINVLNSYDGSTNLQVMAGGYRVVCANGMVIGSDIAKFSRRHTSEFNPNVIRHQLAAALESFNNAGANWHKWSTTPITDSKAMQLIDFHVGVDRDGKSKSEKTRSEIMGYWYTEKAEIGPTLWALFNALTYWSTHQDVKGASAGNRAAIVVEREKRVARTLSHNLFKDAA